MNVFLCCAYVVYKTEIKSVCSWDAEQDLSEKLPQKHIKCRLQKGEKGLPGFNAADQREGSNASSFLERFSKLQVQIFLCYLWESC